MFLNSWSIALSFLSLIVIILTLLAANTAIKVIRYWDISSDSNKQIRLENETWLASTLVQYALAFQIISLVLYVLAADQFSQVIAGAMCATGSFTANSYGLPTLAIKLAGVFLYGFWLVLNQFDISSEKYPLLKAKYVFLLFLVPLLITDISLQTLYIAELEPDIITSCCAVVFGEGGDSSSNLFGAQAQSTVLYVFYGLSLVLLVFNYLQTKTISTLLTHTSACLWVLFLIVSFYAITTVFSSYVYAMPYHRCPFCIIKSEYNYWGIFQYISLLLSVFWGVSISPILLIKNKELKQTVNLYRKQALILSSVLLGIFVALTSYHIVIYKLLDGEF